jgi:hypothetical protein
MILKNVHGRKRKKGVFKRKMKLSLLLNVQLKGPLKNEQRQCSCKHCFQLQLRMQGINFIIILQQGYKQAH